MKNMFYIIDQDDESKFPLIGTENFDSEGNPLMSDEDFELFGHNIADLMKLRCPKRNLALVWETIPDFTAGLPGLGEDVP